MEEKTIKVGKYKIIVRQHTFGMSLRRFTLMEAAQNDTPVDGDGLEAVIRNGFHRATYPSLVACSDGKFPNEQECIDTLSETELNEWLDAARELNPDWFPQSVTKEEAEKNS